MKLLFEKKDPQNIEVKIEQEGNIRDFDYVTMLKGLLDCGSLQEPEMKGDFTDIEKASIASMVKRLNECVPLKDGQVDLDKSSAEDDDV